MFNLERGGRERKDHCSSRRTKLAWINGAPNKW
jgi:hypothetical protein